MRVYKNYIYFVGIFENNARILGYLSFFIFIMFSKLYEACQLEVGRHGGVKPLLKGVFNLIVTCKLGKMLFTLSACDLKLNVITEMAHCLLGRKFLTNERAPVCTDVQQNKMATK